MQNLQDDEESSAPAEGLFVRPAEPSDAEALNLLANLPGYRAQTLRLPFASIASTRKWLDGLRPDYLLIVAVLDDQVVGSASLFRLEGRRSHVGRFGIGVHDGHLRKGIGSVLLSNVLDSADNWLGVKRMELTVFADNHAAIGLYEKFGFEREGLLKGFALRSGVLADALVMARTQP